MTRLSPSRFPWTGANVLFCSAVVCGAYLALRFWSPLGRLDSAGAALASTVILAAAFVLPPALVLLLGAGRARRRRAAPDVEDAGSALPRPSHDPREIWLTRGGLSRDVIAGLVLGLLLALMNGLSIQRGVGETPAPSMGALASLVCRSRRLGEVATLLLALGFVAPVAEEVFFRGVLYAGLRKQVPVVPAVLLSGAVFAAAHFDTMRAHAFLLGVVAAILVECTGSLVPAILAHVGVNTGFVLFLANGGLLAKAAPFWALVAAFVAMNVLFFLLGQPLFGKPEHPGEPEADPRVAPGDEAEPTEDSSGDAPADGPTGAS